MFKRFALKNLQKKRKEKRKEKTRETKRNELKKQGENALSSNVVVLIKHRKKR